MADVLGDDTLFDGFCLTFYETDDALLQLCKDFAVWNDITNIDTFPKTSIS